MMKQKKRQDGEAEKQRKAAWPGPKYESPEEHIAYIVDRTATALEEKYLCGQKEHGGQLWRQPCWWKAYEEALDITIYLDVVREHIRAIEEIAESGLAWRTSPRDALRDILSIIKGDESR